MVDRVQNINIKKSIFFSLSMIVFVITGLLNIYAYNYLPVTSILEIVIILTFLFSQDCSIKVRLFKYFFICIFYLLITFFISQIRGIHILDYVLAYKVFYYIIILSLINDKNIFRIKTIYNILNYLLFGFIIKYVYVRFLGIDDRPGLFTENNYELIFLLIIFVYLNQQKVITYFHDILLIIIFFLSGSRSGLVTLMVYLFSRYFNNKKYLMLKFFFAIVFIVGVIIVFIGRSKALDFQDIDRIIFLRIFFDEISDWNLINYLFGTMPLKPVSNESFLTLNYYKSLFSYGNPSIAYSVILHSFILRVIFDHGLIGLVFIFTFIYKLLIWGKITVQNTHAILLILFLSGLSVSSLNNAYAITALLVILNVKGEQNEKN